MNIYEALAEAKKSSGVICRPFTEVSKILVRPDFEGFMLEVAVLYSSLTKPDYKYGWNPTVEDLTATDWEVWTDHNKKGGRIWRTRKKQI
ncbi:MAG: hypothetical protein ACI4MM_08620 [Candidatus Ventricola sp.]